MKLSDIASSIKSANAGATQITMDIVFGDPAAYRRVVASGVLTQALVAALYQVDKSEVEIYDYDPASTIKVTVPRAVLSGGVEERDFDGVQQYIPLLDVQVPDGRQDGAKVTDQGGGFEATRRICDFIGGYDIATASDVLLARARDLLVDTFGVAVAACDDEVAHVVGALQASGGSGGAVTVVGRGRTQDAGFAALFNGALAHTLEFDDSTLNPVGHPSCVIVPALFALGEERRASGRAFLEAYLVGLEVHSRLGQAEAGGWSAGGFWLPIGHVSLMGAAAACAKLLKLSPVQCEHALGLAAHFCGGLSVSNGALAKPLGAGMSARAGLEAALLAQAGATGASRVIERPQGFADVFLGAGHDLPKGLARLGAPHHLEEIGIAIKRYPSCYATHWGVDALLLLLGEHGLAAGDIAAITLDHPESGAFCDNPRPATTEEARFSHEYNLAAAALDGLPGPRSYTTERMARPDIGAMFRRVQTRNHPADLAPPGAWEYRVAVATTSGQTLSRAVPRPLGHPRHPMSPADLQTKFFTCVEAALDRDQANRLLAALQGVDALPDLAPLSAILSNVNRAPVAQGG